MDYERVKLKTKGRPTSLRFEPTVRTLLVTMAKAEGRSVGSYIEEIVKERAIAAGLAYRTREGAFETVLPIERMDNGNQV